MLVSVRVPCIVQGLCLYCSGFMFILFRVYVCIVQGLGLYYSGFMFILFRVYVCIIQGLCLYCSGFVYPIATHWYWGGGFLLKGVDYGGDIGTVGYYVCID